MTGGSGFRGKLERLVRKVRSRELCFFTAQSNDEEPLPDVEYGSYRALSRGNQGRSLYGHRVPSIAIVPSSRSWLVLFPSLWNHGSLLESSDAALDALVISRASRPDRRPLRPGHRRGAVWPARFGIRTVRRRDRGECLLIGMTMRVDRSGDDRAGSSVRDTRGGACGLTKSPGATCCQP